MNAFNSSASPEMVSRFVVIADTGVTHHGNWAERANAEQFAWGVSSKPFEAVQEVPAYRFERMLSPAF